MELLDSSTVPFLALDGHAPSEGGSMIIKSSSWTHSSCLKRREISWPGGILHNFRRCTNCILTWNRMDWRWLLMPLHSLAIRSFKITHELKHIQHAAIHILSNQSKHCHIIPLLHKLHWWPLNFQVYFLKCPIGSGSGHSGDHYFFNSFSHPI